MPLLPSLFMHWIAPSEKDTANDMPEKRLWAATDQFRANSCMNPQRVEERIRITLSAREELLRVIAAEPVPLRPSRSKARVRKRRHKPQTHKPQTVQVLTKSRHKMVVSPSCAPNEVA